MESLKNFKKIVLFDLETTGFSPVRDRVVEFGAVVIENGERLEYNYLVNPGMAIPNSDIHGITDQMVQKDGISYDAFKIVVNDLFKSSEDILFGAYNTQFDMSFIFELLIDKDFSRFNLLDVMAIYKDRNGWDDSLDSNGKKYGHRLDAMVKNLNVSVPNTHRALDDVMATLEGLDKLAAELDNIDLYVNVIGFNAKYGVSGVKLPHIKYISQYFNGQREIETEMSNVSNQDVDDTEVIYVLSTRGLSGDKRYFAADRRIDGLNKPLLFSRTIFKLMTLKECNNAIFVANREYNVSNKEKQERLKNLKIERVVFEEIG